MDERREKAVGWTDLLWLGFLAGLALLSPIKEVHKQITLLAIAVFQLMERRLIARFPRRGPSYTVLIKIALATLLLGHTGEIGINSSYYPIYYLPVVTAAIYFGMGATLLWTLLASAAYCSYLYPALKEYELTEAGLAELAIRILFFFFAAVLVNQFAMANRRQMQRIQQVSDSLRESHRQLQRAQAERRRAERLAALGQLSAGLAHEIRNPLGVIKGSAEMLRQKLQGSQPVVSELAGFISSEVVRLNALVARFLDFARPSRLELRPVDAGAIVDRALDAVRAQLPHSKVEVERDYVNGVPNILADAQLCEQVFVNLILNAYEAMEGSGKLRISIVPAAMNGQQGAAVEVADSGPGVPENLREQIFNPFVSSKQNGVGLGLSIVAKIVDDHRGSIRLHAGPEPGACFRVFFPTVEAAFPAVDFAEAG
jgi:signal transduction histidine kinase